MLKKGNQMSNEKIKVPVYIIASATKHIGDVELEEGTVEEYEEKAGLLWEEKGFDHPTLNVHNDFDMGDWDIMKQSEADLSFYKKETK